MVSRGVYQPGRIDRVGHVRLAPLGRYRVLPPGLPNRSCPLSPVSLPTAGRKLIENRLVERDEVDPLSTSRDIAAAACIRVLRRRSGHSDLCYAKASEPADVATDSDGNLYVADANNNRLQKLSASGAFVTKWGTLGSGDGQFASPQSVTTDAFGNVYVSDITNNQRVQKFKPTG